ncbi:serine hydrolase [Streptomyces sp. NPDC101132]|uniref:serine hydrolase n=1 Tax=Streptomyces sp. NPDC101132 TaxID=3366110 RepID=UPI003829DDF7
MGVDTGASGGTGSGGGEGRVDGHGGDERRGGELRGGERRGGERRGGEIRVDGRGAGGAGRGGVGRGVSRRALGGRLLALGGLLALQSLPGTASARWRGGASWRSLRYGSAREAGLLEAYLERASEEARRFLGPSPERPWYAGAVVLAGRGRTVALHEAVGDALRYGDYDGRADTARELPYQERIAMTRDTVFDLASLTKLFTSVLAVQQIERGALDLEAPVVEHLPEFCGPEAAGSGKERITVRQLLTHTSGLRSWVPFYRETTPEGRLGLLWAVRPQDPPGSVYRYSDLNLIALHLLLERVTGRPLDVQLRREITAPLGMRRTRFRPPRSWRPLTAATEVARPPWSGLDRGLVWGEVHDENAHVLGGVAGHAGVFGTAWDLAVLARALLDGGTYDGTRILSAASVELLFTDFNTAFPGDDHGLGFELYQHWYMGAMATPHAAGHTGFTGTSMVLDPSTDSFLILLGNSVHPVRTWRAGSAPRVAVANQVARAVPVRTRHGGPAWFSGMATGGTGTLELPAVAVPAVALPPGAGTGAGATGAVGVQLQCDLWWDTVPRDGWCLLEGSADGGRTWAPVPFSTTPAAGGGPQAWPGGRVGGWSGRVWHRLAAPLDAWAGRELRLRFRHSAEGRYVGRGVYLDGLRVRAGDRTLFAEDRPADAARIRAAGWTRSAD